MQAIRIEQVNNDTWLVVARTITAYGLARGCENRDILVICEYKPIAVDKARHIKRKVNGYAR